MPPTTHAADTADRLDPWGFGTTASDEPTAVIEITGLSDDDDDDFDDSGAHDALVGLVSRITAGPRVAASRAAWQPFTPASMATESALAEARPAAAPESTQTRPVSREAAGVLALLTLVILGQALYIGLSVTGEVRASAAPTGEVVLSSHPAGARVTIDGLPQGVTPMVMTLPVGRHVVEIAGPDGAPQTLHAEVTEGAPWTRHLVLASTAGAAPGGGALRIDTVRPGAAVWLDGTQVGRTPLTVPGLSAGVHAVRVQFAGGIVERRVALAGGETVSLVLDAPVAKPVTPTWPASGWVRVETPFEVQITEGGQVVGSSASARIMVTAGPHVFELANAALGYRVTVKAVVGAGRTEALVVDAPRTPVHVNAQPWAEVLVDGRLLGETPLANVPLSIGVHQVVFRHPEFGERTQSVTVRLNGPNRVTADLRR